MRRSKKYKGRAIKSKVNILQERLEEYADKIAGETDPERKKGYQSMLMGIQKQISDLGGIK